jgi:hypothetical protein
VKVRVTPQSERSYYLRSKTIPGGAEILDTSLKTSQLGNSLAGAGERSV